LVSQYRLALSTSLNLTETFLLVKEFDSKESLEAIFWILLAVSSF